MEKQPMETDNADSGAGTPIERESAAIVHTIGPHYSRATAADAGEAIAQDAQEMADTPEPEFEVPVTHTSLSPDSGTARGLNEPGSVVRKVDQRTDDEPAATS